ncbi:MAG: UvrD-helicase domain-containing protein [Prevotellaceae bacterium]|jgi:ATP-dependent exoDNAse (exonuclease V) beta subunit|nr:UvrD-helicase domain-containing protein [Prevotellaceae bacterium]
MALNIYKASAGSGKTYTITNEYLRWLLPVAKFNPSAFRSVLAVTFTNKATGEMKRRIVEALNDVAENKHKQAVTSLCETLRMTPEELTKSAKALRTAILHDYSHFAVSTIDKFFQKIIRAFMHEADLSPEYTVELDTERLLDESVERLLQESLQDELLSAWLHLFVEERMEDGKHWDIRNELKERGKEVFKKDFDKKSADKNFLNGYVNELKKITDEFENEMKKYSAESLKILDDNNLCADDFKYKKGGAFINYFSHIKKNKYEPGKRAIKAQDDINEWYGNDADKNIQIDQIYPTLNACLTKAIALYKEKYIHYNTAQQIQRNIYSLGLLADIANHIRIISKEENVMPISDSLHLLDKLVSGSDAPFIYEKTGARFQSFMLDEFQDTSNMQWNILKPLLENGLAESGNTLVVGDVKQSIYRWRDGDWRILAEKLDKDLRAFDPIHKNLDVNWRSAPVIIHTNNELFGKMPQLLQQMLADSFKEADYDDKDLHNAITEAYTNTAQKVASKNAAEKGYVHIETLDKNDDDASTKDKALQKVNDLVNDLKKRGYPLSDIGILVRTKKEGQAVADMLLENGISVISQDSLFVARSPFVQFVMGILYQAIYQDDSINRKSIENFLKKREITIPSDFDEWLAALVQQSLAEAVETIIAHFKPTETDLPFIQELHDIILMYSTKESGDIYSFVEWWAEKNDKQMLAISDEQDAVKILTIHKAKGLQFNVVIIPFCRWKLEPKPNTLLWVQCHEAPFNSIQKLPLNYTSQLADTHFRSDYFKEKTQAYIDNLNLLYVAFTRAEKELYVFTTKEKNTVGSLITACLGNDCFDAGEQSSPVTADSENKTEQTLITWNDYPSKPYINHLKLRYSDEKKNDDAVTSWRDNGILMHRAFSEIKTAKDVETSIQSIILQGFVENNPIMIAHLRKSIEDALQQPEAAPWFDGSWEVQTETDILLPNTDGQFHSLRPDRVMIKNGKVVVVDYKFGENEPTHYEEQVKNYIDCLKKMGFPEVEGFLWYVNKKRILSINF